MRILLVSVIRFLHADDGPTAVEYAIMLALLIAVCFTAIGFVGHGASNLLSNVALQAAAGS
jgi:pilus assembly protein Flp/PilA